MGFQFGSLIEDKERKIQIAFGEKDGYRIELVMPMKKGSPIDQILANIGPTPYHICYETDCLEKAVEQLTCGGVSRNYPVSSSSSFWRQKSSIFVFSCLWSNGNNGMLRRRKI